MLPEKVVYPKNMTAEKIPEDRRHLVSEPVQYQPSYLGHIMYCGRLIPARSTAACFMMFDSDSPKSHEIPQSLRVGAASALIDSNLGWFYQWEMIFSASIAVYTKYWLMWQLFA